MITKCTAGEKEWATNVTITGDNIANIITTAIVTVIAPVTLRWSKEVFSNKKAAKKHCEDAIRELAETQFNCKLIESHYDDLESVVKRVCAEFHKSGAITRHEIEALEGELAQRPKVE